MYIARKAIPWMEKQDRIRESWLLLLVACSMGNIESGHRY
jgi:hypothetical protein